MLPRAARLRHGRDFRAVLRRGRRITRDPLVVVVLTDFVAAGGPRAGLVVSRKVGPAVVRNQVRRRLRAVLAARLPVLPAGSAVVVRALPAAAAATSAELGDRLDAAFQQLAAAA
ncbi:MAG: ribonuclease P protein component [Mycobacteriales bacterium]|nr:ribonuclease P protein component [Frankia sp.]